ncbi:MAG: pilus assembly protein N-terminal domain-containing protein, partial [Planctomycetota bacterium]
MKGLIVKSISTRIWVYQIICIFIILLISNTMQGYTAEQEFSKGSVEVEAKPLVETISIIVGESTIVETPWPSIRVAVTDPKIADVKVLTPYQVLLQGVKVGSTDLIIWSQDEREVWHKKVRVGMDLDNYQAKLNELFPRSSLQVRQSDETLIVKGLLRSSDQTVQLQDYLGKTGVPFVDMTSVAGIQQVQLQVRVAEVSRAALRALGVNAFHTDDDFFGGMR